MTKTKSGSHAVVRGRRRRGACYLVARGDSWFFQIRVPLALTPTRRLPPLRVRIFADSRRTALRRAMVLAAYAKDAFERRADREVGPVDGEHGGEDGGAFFLEDDVGPFLQELRVLEERLREPTGLDRLPIDTLIGMKAIGEIVEIGREENEGGHPLVRRNAELLRNQALKRLRIATGTPEPDGLELLMGQLAKIRKGHARLMERLGDGEGPPPPAAADAPVAHPGIVEASGTKSADRLPLFSEVAEEYLELRSASGTSGIGTARYRLGIFLEVVGDRPIDEYRPIDLQRYVNEIQHLPKIFRSDRPDARAFDGMSAPQAIEANRGGRWEPLGIKTIQDGYVQVVKATASFAAAHNRISHPFNGVPLRWPSGAKPSVKRTALDFETMDRVFKAGVASGYLDDALLLPLSFLTSRRIGLLAFLRGSDLTERHGVTTVQVNGIVFDKAARAWKRIPYKTEESLRFFVLHDLFRRIGFVDWAAAQGDDFLFRALHQVQDPSAVASQRSNRLLDQVGAKSAFVKVAHSFRHGAKDLMTDDMIDDTSSRLQMGHEISDVHSDYGRRPELSRAECRKLASIKLPTQIDWSVFRNLDFEAMASRKRATGRPRNE